MKGGSGVRAGEWFTGLSLVQGSLQLAPPACRSPTGEFPEGHDWNVWRAALSDAPPWVTDRVGLAR